MQQNAQFGILSPHRVRLFNQFGARLQHVAIKHTDILALTDCNKTVTNCRFATKPVGVPVPEKWEFSWTGAVIDGRPIP